MVDQGVADLRREREAARVAHDQNGVSIPQHDRGDVRSREGVGYDTSRRTEGQERTEQNPPGRPMRACNDAVLVYGEWMPTRCLQAASPSRGGASRGAMLSRSKRDKEYGGRR